MCPIRGKNHSSSLKFISSFLFLHLPLMISNGFLPILDIYFTSWVHFPREAIPFSTDLINIVQTNISRINPGQEVESDHILFQYKPISLTCTRFLPSLFIDCAIQTIVMFLEYGESSRTPPNLISQSINRDEAI